MKIKKFRILNYKSIIDSGDCYLEIGLTILAGKNESGKSSILEALADFNYNKSISEEAIPIKDKSKLPVISLNIVLSIEDQTKYFKKLQINKKVRGEVEIQITKNYPNKYTLDQGSYELFEIAKTEDGTEQDILKSKINSAYLEFTKLHNHLFHARNLKVFTLNLDEIPNTINQINTYLRTFNTSPFKRYLNPTQRQSYISKIQNLKSSLEDFEKRKSVSGSPSESFFELFPNFILFKSFEDLIPNEIPLSQLESSELVKDLTTISNLNISLIKSNDKRNKLKHNSEINVKLNKEYAKYWTQDTTQLKLHWDNDSLEFWIVEDDQNFKPSERSKGKQWHLSFYTKISARSIDTATNVILIDEPGLYLHATAQKDVYRRLIGLSKNNQIIYTTHSPYLINRDQLNRVRLVIKNSNGIEGTMVENKIHSKADKETLTPILTAIGLELSDGIQNINQIENIVVEGPSDYFYLQGFKVLLGSVSFNIIFGGGAGNMGKIGAILKGWGCKVIYLYDNDKGKVDGSKNLVKNWLVSKELILTVKDGSGSIEDIFSKQDFMKYILKVKGLRKDLTNSELIKSTKLDKVLLARQFNSLCQSTKIALSNETLSDVKRLFMKLEEALII